MDESLKNAVEEYQCPGCVCGCDITCYTKGYGEECGKHVAGTTMFSPTGIVRFFLGMPKGFNRLGQSDDLKVEIFVSFDDGWGYDHLNVPVWKHRNARGDVLVRGLSPRTNTPFLHVFLDDCIDMINCHEISESDLSEMD